GLSPRLRRGPLRHGPLAGPPRLAGLRLALRPLVPGTGSRFREPPRPRSTPARLQPRGFSSLGRGHGLGGRGAPQALRAGAVGGRALRDPLPRPLPPPHGSGAGLPGERGAPAFGGAGPRHLSGGSPRSAQALPP